VDYLQVLLENRAILWKKRRLIQTAVAQAAEESEDCWIESLQRIPEVIFQKNHQDLFVTHARVAARSVARMYGTAESGTSIAGFKKHGLSTVWIAKDESPERSLTEDGLSKFYD
jgi:hypothetical protein